MGDGVTWGEARTLIEEAAADGGTAIGAELAGWAYPASIRQLIELSALIGSQKVAKQVMPWAMENPRRKQKDQPTADEVAAAQAELEAGIVFS